MKLQLLKKDYYSNGVMLTITSPGIATLTAYYSGQVHVTLSGHGQSNCLMLTVFGVFFFILELKTKHDGEMSRRKYMKEEID